MSNPPETEQGHFAGSPLASLFWECFGSGFLLGSSASLVMPRASCHGASQVNPEGSTVTTDSTMPIDCHTKKACAQACYLITALSAAAATSNGVREYAEQLQYEQEYAREVWEHELSPQREIEEYCEFAEAQGVSAFDAKIVAEELVKLPGLSVPFHLALELGMVKPVHYGAIRKRALVSFSGYLSGGMSGLWLGRFTRRTLANTGLPGTFASAAILGLVACGPLIALQHAYLYRLRKFKSIQSRATLAYGSVLMFASALGLLFSSFKRK